jgi:6-pyruvoyltetrahydropterin/6-carboxytetrahydropterin synthase
VARALLTRRVGFTASHRYPSGAFASEDAHEHHYRCDVTVGGEIDPTTGFVINLEDLDSVIHEVVLARFDKQTINRDVPVPSGENLAKFIYERIEEALGDRGTVVEVRVAEDETLWATYHGGG